MNTAPSEHDPRELMLRAKEGDADAFGLIYELYFTPIYRYIYFRLRHKEDAEDLVQAVFVRAFQSVGRFKVGNQAPLAFFYTVARNAIIDHWRKKKDVLMGENDMFLAENYARSEKDPLDELSSRDAARMIDSALHYLTEEQQEVITLKFLSEWSTKEIAAHLGKSEAAVRQLQCRAIKTMRDHVKPYES